MTPEKSVRHRLATTITVTLLGCVPAFAQNAGAVQPVSLKSAARAGMRAQPTTKRPSKGRHVKIRTRAGDTLSLLADRFGVTPEEIAQMNGMEAGARVDAGRELLIPLPSPEGLMRASEERLSQHNGNGALNAGADSVSEADGGWENVQGVLMRRGSGRRSSEAARDEVAEISQNVAEQKREREPQLSKVVEVSDAMRGNTRQPVWIYLVGGARVEADEVTETPEGVWYKRGGLSVFVERARVERVERERVSGISEPTPSWTERGWTTGNPRFDALIKENGARYGVDPYLIFCVMEQESHFNQYVVSPKGARGLMQLMPATAARFGVRRTFDPAENIMGGTKYLKQLLENFQGRVDLVLAGYNAGEGAVAKYGGNVPPYKETRNYVKRISKRYGQSRSFAPTAGVEPASGTPSGLR